MAPETRQETPPTNPAKEFKKDPAPQPPVVTLPDPGCKPMKVGNKAPEPCDVPPCPTCCDCPPAPGDTPGCLEKLIRCEAQAISKGERAKRFKSELEALLGKVKAAALEYTPDAYDDLLERWKTEDEAIVCLVRSIQCALPCWWCVIECELCPLVNDIVRQESRLSGEVKNCDEKPADCHPQDVPESGDPECIASLYDLRHWWWREKLKRQALFDLAAGVMKAWETPFKTIDGVLKANADILKTAASALGIEQKKDAAKLLFDVFFRLIPQHMAIAPPAAVAPTGIAKKYVELCCCDNSPVLHECCGVIVRLPTVRDRLIGPLPYLIAPSTYANLICCLATNVYLPAKEASAEGDSQYAEIDTEVKAIEAAIAAQVKSLPVDAKLRLGKTILCKDYKAKTGSDGETKGCCDDEEPPPEDCDPPAKPAPTQQTTRS